MKNEENTFGYNIDELVEAYPDQAFLHASQERAWQRLQGLKQKEKKVIAMRRIISIAAAVIVMVASSMLLLFNNHPSVGDSFEATIASFNAPMKNNAKADTLQQIVTKPTLNTSMAIKNLEDNIPVIIKQPVISSKAIDSAQQKTENVSAQFVSFRHIDSVQTTFPATPKQKIIPPSTNELFDGMQKLANSKLKTDHKPAIAKPTNNTTAPNADTLFPKSFN